MACCKKTSPYSGIPFNEQHSARLTARLEKVILGSMAQASDPLYDAKFADAVRPSTAHQTAAGSAQSGGSEAHPNQARAKPRPKPKPKSQPAPTDDEPVDSEDTLSGDYDQE